MAANPGLALVVTILNLRPVVDAAVDLNNQVVRGAVEVEDEGSHGMLSPKVHSKLVASKRFPEDALGGCRRLAQFAGALLKFR